MDKSLFDYIGHKCVLDIDRHTQHGIYLVLNNESVLLPFNEITIDNINALKRVEVFLYTDSSDRIVATMREPLAMLDDIAFLEVKDQNEYGIFLDIGLSKDIFMPTKRTHSYKIGSKVLVAICKDKEHRLIAKKDINRLLRPCHDKGMLNRIYDAIIYGISPLGFKVLIIGSKYHAMIYKDNAYLRLYDTCKIKIAKIRNDGKLDAILAHSSDDAIEILRGLSRDGFFVLREDSNLHFGTSKKGLKKLLSRLINEKKIEYCKDMGYRILR